MALVNLVSILCVLCVLAVNNSTLIYRKVRKGPRLCRPMWMVPLPLGRLGEALLLRVAQPSPQPSPKGRGSKGFAKFRKAKKEVQPRRASLGGFARSTLQNKQSPSKPVPLPLLSSCATHPASSQLVCTEENPAQPRLMSWVNHPTSMERNHEQRRSRKSVQRALP